MRRVVWDGTSGFDGSEQRVLKTQDGATEATAACAVVAARVGNEELSDVVTDVAE